MNTIASEDIIFSELSGKNGSIGHILLNRPKALNALTTEMCQAFYTQLTQWQNNKQIKAVIIQGEGERAFCAGGDIRSLYYNGKENVSEALNFFRHEYRMNAAIFHFNKPYIALLDGITMGGGAGVSMHGSHRVATERLVYAMPETGIGFFPDIGAGHFLSRLAERIGIYLGLTGDRINAADAFQFGIVKHVISSDKQSDIVQALTDLSFTARDHDKVSAVLDSFAVKPETSKLSNFRHQIADCFDASSINEIIVRLEELNSDWSRHTLKKLQSKSPISLKVTFEQLRRAVNMKFDDIMNMEFNIASQFLRTPDFYEGVRAAVIDKDQSPHWQPASLKTVTDEMVQKFFSNELSLELD